MTRKQALSFQSRPVEAPDQRVSSGIRIRLYHFLSAEHALEDIAQRRLKISQIDQLNDPFELWCASRLQERNERPVRHALFQQALAQSCPLEPLCGQTSGHLPRF